MGAITGEGDFVYLGELAQDRALEAMLKKAEEIGLDKGVAFIVVQKKGQQGHRIAYTVLEVERDPNLDKAGDIGRNYFGTVMLKLAQMLATYENSGPSDDRPLKAGEVDYEGGIVFEPDDDHIVLIGYSGGTEEEDVDISLIGKTKLLKPL